MFDGRVERQLLLHCPSFAHPWARAGDGRANLCRLSFLFISNIPCLLQELSIIRPSLALPCYYHAISKYI